MSTQSLDRAIALLRLVSSSSPQGSRLVDLQRETQLTKPTVHRLLETLCQNEFLRKDESSKRYHMGREIGLLAASATPASYDLTEICKDHMIEVAQRSGDTSFLTVRSGYDAVCMDRQSGAYPVKAFTVDVGTRRPLGVGAGSIVLLAALEAEERTDVYDAVRKLLKTSDAALKESDGTNANTTIDEISSAVEDARRLGYAYSDGLVLQGVRGIAVPILNGDGKAIAALSIAAIKDRISRQRMPQLLSILRTHAAFIEKRIRQKEA